MQTICLAQIRLSELNKGQIKIGSNTTARVQWVKVTFTNTYP